MMNKSTVFHDQPQRPHRSRSGFTLIEMIMVIGTIAFLLAMLVAMTGRVQQQAAVRSTRGIINQIEVALQDYYDTYGYYPRENDADNGFRILNQFTLYEHLVSPDFGGFLAGVSAMAVERDPATGKTFLVDAWKGPIRVIIFSEAQVDHWRMNGGQPLIFSTGRDRAGWGNGAAFSGASADKMRQLIVEDSEPENRDNITNFRDIPSF